MQNQPVRSLASVIEEDKKNGFKAYGGEPLTKKIAQLVDEMNISVGTV